MNANADRRATALRLCLERILPARKDRPVPFALPKLETAADALQAMAALMSAVAARGADAFASRGATIFGQHGLQISNVRHLAGNFNAHLRDTCLLFADEALWPGDREAEGTLKRLLTEDTLFVEPKGFDGFKSPNYLHVIMASNEDWVVPASRSARRFAVFEVSSERKQNTAYFKALDDELQSGGLQAMLHDLLQMDLKRWHPRNVVRTDALRDQQFSSLSCEAAWWLTVLEEGALPGAAAGALDVARMSDLLADLKQKHPRAAYVTEQRFGKFLRGLGAEPGKWLSDRRGWRFPPLATARAAWEKIMPGYRWDDPNLKGWGEEAM